MDSDDDGWMNIDEINRGTHPADPMSNPSMDDNEPPKVSITSPANGAELTDKIVKIQGTASDNKMLEAVEIEVTGFPLRKVTVSNGIWQSNYEFSRGGNFEITVTAKDRVGNSSTAESAFTVIFDDEDPPRIDFVFPQQGATIDSFPVLFKGRASDVANSVELVEYSLDSGETWKEAKGTNNWQFAVPIAPVGRNEFWVRATDTVGNVSRPFVLVINIEMKELEIPTITYPIDEMIVDSSTLTVSGTFARPASFVEVKIDDESWVRATTDGYLWHKELSNYDEGEHTLTARAVDIYNRPSDSHSISFTFVPRDSTPPEVFFKTPSENSSFEIGYVEFSGDASDDSGIAFVEYQVGNSSWEKAVGKEEWSFRQNLGEPGISSVFVRATDAYGNTSEAVELKVIILDPLEFVFEEADSDELKNGKLVLEVSWNRELDSDPQVILSGVTNGFETENLDDKKMIIRADLGAGQTDILVYGFLNGRVEKSTSVKYQAVVSLTIGSDIMVVGRNIVKIPEPALIVDGRLYIPFRSMGEAFGAKVSWDADTKTAKYQLGDYSYEMTLNSSTAKVNGGAIEMSNVPLIIRDRMMIPVRAVSEVLGAEVDYDAETRTATITL